MKRQGGGVKSRKSEIGKPLPEDWRETFSQQCTCRYTEKLHKKLTHTRTLMVRCLLHALAPYSQRSLSKEEEKIYLKT